LTVPPLFSAGVSASAITSAFNVGSAGNVRLALDLNPLATPFVPVSNDGLTRPLDLHLAAAWLLGTAPAPPARVDRIGGESGGYTFRKPGRHQLWAEFDAGFVTSLRSNLVEVNLLPWTALRGPMNRFAELLPRQLGKIVAYHRLLPTADTRAEPYERLVEECPELPARSELRYAMGCAYAAVRSGDPSGREKARRWLAEAAADQRLDEHRRANAACRLARLPESRL
jgi:hypothetical protein